MNKILVKPMATILLKPNGVYDLKRDLLLYDKVGILDVKELYRIIEFQKDRERFNNIPNEINFLIDKGLFTDIGEMLTVNEVEMNDRDRELADYTMKLQGDSVKTNDIKEKNRLFWEWNELNTRLWSRIVNTNNDAIYAVSYLSNLSSFELNNTTKEKAFSIIHKLLPLPTDDTPWEKILDFKEDNESKLKLLALKNFLNDLPSDIRYDDLEDRIRYLTLKYEEALKRHKIETRLTKIKTIVTTIPEALTELVRLKFDKAIGAFFTIAEQQVNFSKYEERSKLPGNELAYISHIKDHIEEK